MAKFVGPQLLNFCISCLTPESTLAAGMGVGVGVGVEVIVGVKVGASVGIAVGVGEGSSVGVAVGAIAVSVATTSGSRVPCPWGLKEASAGGRKKY